MSTKKTPAIAKASSAKAASQRQSLEGDRQLFHLKTLYEASWVLSIPVNPEDILKQFLPIAMGPLGLVFGFAILLRSDKVHVEGLGLDENTISHYKSTGADLVSKFFPDKITIEPASRPTILVGHHLANDPNLSSGTTSIIAIPIEEGSYTVLGFGPKLSEQSYGEDEIELLQGLATILMAALKKACADEHIHALNADLNIKNTRMKQTLERMEKTQKELNRHAFQLQTLYETSLELSSINNPESILNAFILTLMGTFSYSSGWIALYGPGSDEADVIYRGPDQNQKNLLASTKSRKKILTRFVALKDKMPQNNQSCLLEDAETLSSLPPINNNQVAILAVLFSLDQGWRGAIGLSSPLSDTPLKDEMKRLIKSLTGNFMVTLGNAKHSQLIQNLNSNLAARNVELQGTLDELTSAKQEIGILTEAKERIIGLVHGEVARVWRASWLDVCIIILAGVVLGTLFNYSSPSGIRLVPQSLFEPASVMMDVHAANREAQKGTAVIIDCRPAEFYMQGHIPNALNLPMNLFNFVYSMKLANLDPEMLLIVYGRTISRHYDEEVARELRLLGHENIKLIQGGLAAWDDAGYGVAK